MSCKLPIAGLTVIPSKAGIHLRQWVMDFGSPLRYGRNDGSQNRRAFFSILQEVNVMKSSIGTLALRFAATIVLLGPAITTHAQGIGQSVCRDV
jgi:hypothetical protein